MLLFMTVKGKSPGRPGLNYPQGVAIGFEMKSSFQVFASIAPETTTLRIRQLINCRTSELVAI
jgi:hypothetical protein